MINHLCDMAPRCWKKNECAHAKLHTFRKDICNNRICSVTENDLKRAVVCIPYKERKFIRGDRVVFTQNSHDYSIYENNPLLGTEYFCGGLVVSSGGGITVAWDNGSENGYSTEDLEYEYMYLQDLAGYKLRQIDPNISFAILRRRKRI